VANKLQWVAKVKKRFHVQKWTYINK